MKHTKIRLLICAAILLTAFLGGCSAGSQSSGPVESRYEAAESANMPSAVSDASSSQSAYGGSAPQAIYDMGVPTADITLSAAQTRKVVRTARFSISTLTFDDNLATIRKTVSDMGGYFEESNISAPGNDSARYGQMTARVPVDKFDELIDFLRAFPDVLNESTNDTDMTETYVDYQIRIDVLKQNLERLQMLQEQSTDIDTIIRLQQEMNSVLLQLESLTSELRHLDGQTEYATVYLTLQERFEEELQLHAADDNLLSNMASGFVHSSNGVFAFLRGLLVVIAMLLPVLLLLAAIFAVVCVIFRLVTKRWPFQKKNTPQK